MNGCQEGEVGKSGCSLLQSQQVFR